MSPHPVVQVRLMSAAALPAVNMLTSTSDPYVLLTVPRTTQTERSDPCLNTLNPTWYQTFHFHNIHDSDVIQLNIVDRNRRMNDVPLGSLIISLQDAFNHIRSQLSHHRPTHLDTSTQKYLSRTYPVSPVGSITLLIFPFATPSLYHLAPPKPFKCFMSQKVIEDVTNFGKHSIGLSPKIMAQTVSHYSPRPVNSLLKHIQPIHKAFQEHSTWKINMLWVDFVFRGARQPWNKEYDAAKKIFDGPASILVRDMVKAQHAYLYGGGRHNLPVLRNFRKDLQEVTGNLLDANDFITLLSCGVRRRKPRMYTYVLMESSLYLAETGANFFTDMSSKHAMHCSAATEVVYAGELHFRREASGRLRLIIDNNSGTYAPNKQYLPHVEDVFRRNFEGLDITALDFKDPILKQYSDELANSSASSLQQIS